MTRSLCLALAFLAATLSARACDVCGCSAPGSYLGILPQFRQHFVGLRYQYQTFQSDHPPGPGETVTNHSSERFQSLTAWVRYYPARRWQVFAFLPYHFNSVTEDGVTTPMQGIGDASLLVNYLIIDKTDRPDSQWKHSLLIGGGIKAPTGSSVFRNKQGIILSNMQPGTGSWDFLANANYTIRKGRTGANVDASFRRPTTNNRDYRYGNKVSTGVSAFYWQEGHRLGWLPQAGVRWEWSGTDLSSAKYGIRNTYSGGSFWYATAGVNVYRKRFAIGALVSVPLVNAYAGGLVRAGLRCESQLQFLF